MIRSVKQITNGVPTSDGAGVKLTRIIGTDLNQQLDPFLLLDEFKSNDVNDYIAGFPSHPHRGFETITYMKEGKFRHHDSTGAEGLLNTGAVQWMTAGRGIIHSEMPEMNDGLLWGYQLWLNLPAKHKMAEPRYQNIPAEKIPIVKNDGIEIKIISGNYQGNHGPPETLFPMIYFDISLKKNAAFNHAVPPEMNSFCYVYEGEIKAGREEKGQNISCGQMAIFDQGDEVFIRGEQEVSGFIFLAGQRIEEPIARSGPFVMNTEEEIVQAYDDYKNGRF